jgi:uncharacterized protein (DUF3084 family)
MKLLILLLPFFISLQAKSQEDKLLIDKGKLVWLLGKHEENKVLKKRIVLKDSTITLLNERLILKDSVIQSYQRDSISLNTIIVNKDIEISKKDKKIKEKTSNNTKLHIQNIFLKVGIGLLAVALILTGSQ